MSKLKLKWTTLLAIMIMAGMISCSSTGGTGGGFTVTISSSSTNVTATSSITLTASATGGTLASVQFLKNGAAIGAPVTAAPFQTQVDLSSADNGSLSFTATATDTTGKTDTSDAVTVTVNIPVDNTPPTVSLATSAATVSDAGSITLTATASDDVGVARVEFFKNGTFIGQAFAAPFSFQAFLTQSDNGSLSFTAKAFDAAGNSSESSPVGVTVNISVATLLRPSKSGSIAISGNNNYIVQVNPENDNVSIFRSAVENGTRVVTKTVDVPVGVEPSSVVIHPDDKTAFVAVRGEAKVVKIADISTATAAITATAAVGSEPTGIALSPSGKLLAVAEFGESRISLVDTTTMAVISSVEIRNPRALAITNDGDNDDTDEKLIVTEFYGEVIPGTVEGQDNTRKGVVRSYALTTLAPQQKTEFLPLAVPDFVPNETSPNQLYAIEISPDNSKFMVVATAASPFSKAKFNENIFQLLLIGDVTTGAAISRINISAAIKNQVAEGKLFMADIVDLGLVGNNVIYFAARGADAFQRAELSGDSQSITLGAG
ncbi:MAG: beta-propeller fold lactonase family protein, partial [Trueperaceae bacterium]|nr:beta-propeller fold lactonase family protein [Trueperaceae bacterium]